MTSSRRMNTKQTAFLKLYLGRDQKYHGNATRCYMKVYDSDNERVSQTSGSRLINTPALKQVIDDYLAKAAEQVGVDATFVLEQSVRLYDRAMGDEAIEVDHITPSGAVVAVERRDINLSIASKALELIGKHTSVQAFQDNVEHTHTHRLELALQAKAKEVEARAAARKPQTIEGTAEIIRNDEIPAQAPEDETEKRVHSAGGQGLAPIPSQKTSPERAGATGK